MSDYLSKPYEETALLSVLARWLPPATIELPPPLDIKTLLARHRPEFVHELTQVFLETTEASLSDLQEALDKRDAQTGQREAHSLRGAAAAVSATVLFQSVTELEAAFTQANWEDVETLIEDVQAEYLRLRNFLDSGAT
jgi:HPt (histidine-containing phosphotransfer) domain-containing protein